MQGYIDERTVNKTFLARDSIDYLRRMYRCTVNQFACIILTQRRYQNEIHFCNHANTMSDFFPF